MTETSVVKSLYNIKQENTRADQLNQSKSRHPGILPRFAVKFVRKSVKSDMGEIEKDRLLSWTDELNPDRYFADSIREAFIKRMRNRFDEVWAEKTCVVVPDAWRNGLPIEDRLKVQEWLSEAGAGDALPSMTLQEFKSILKIPLDRIFRILAAFESEYERLNLPKHVTDSLQLVEDGLKGEIEKLVLKKWIAQVQEDDIRFPGLSGPALVEWLRRKKEEGRIDKASMDLIKSLIEADRLTVEEEMVSIGSAAAKSMGLRREESVARRTTVFTLWLSGKGSLHIADVLDVTRQRSDMILSELEEIFESNSCVTPAIDRALEACASLCPIPIDEADAEIAQHLGPNISFLAILKAVPLLKLASKIEIKEVRFRTGELYDSVKFLGLITQDVSWLETAFGQARKECQMIGCTSLIRIAGHIAFHFGIGVGKEALRALFACLPGYRSLDEEGDWFTLTDCGEGSLSSRVRKILSVANGPVDSDTIASALITDDRWLYRSEYDGLCLPPLHILFALFHSWDWLSIDGHNKCRLIEALSPEIVLSKTELVSMQIIERYGGLATKNEITREFLEETGMSPISISYALGSSMVIHKIEHAIYGLQGREIDCAALDAARMRRRREMAILKPTSALNFENLDLSKPISINVNQSGSGVSVGRRVVYLPNYLAGKAVGIFRHKDGKHGPISCKPNGQVYKLAAVADSIGVKQSSPFGLTLDIPNATYELTMVNAPESGD